MDQLLLENGDLLLLENGDTLLLESDGSSPPASGSELAMIQHLRNLGAY